jgi:hypothetical protein
MSAASGWRPPVRFRGTPIALSAVTPGGPDAASSLSLTLDLPGTPEHRTHAVHSRVGDSSILKLNLPRNTPPGKYTGIVMVGDVEQEVIVDVEPEVFLRLFPERLVFTARASERVQIEMSLANMGNTAVEVRGAYAFGLFDVGGVERAIAKTVTAQLTGESGVRGRADYFADAIADEHGGMVRVKVDEGAGQIAPDEVREMKITLTVPDRVRPGRTYWGTWPLYNLRHYVRITGADGASEDKPS